METLATAEKAGGAAQAFEVERLVLNRARAGRPDPYLGYHPDRPGKFAAAVRELIGR